MSGGVSKCLKESESVKCQGVSKYSMSVGYLDGALRLSGMCLGGLWMVSGGWRSQKIIKSSNQCIRSVKT